MGIRLGNTIINRTYLGSTEINKAYLGSTLIVDDTPDTGFLPVLSNFRVENAQPTRIYFDSSEIITGTDRTGYIVTDKTTSSVTINSGSLTGHYFTVTLAFTFWDNNTIRYVGGGGITDLYSHEPASFTLQYITNNIDEPTNTSFKYVDATGSGAETGADAANAWNPTDGGANASAGDTLYCKAGSYTVSLNVGASGTTNSPIKFIGYRVTPGDAQQVTRTIGMSFDSTKMPLITGAKFDTLAKDYIIVKNFQVQPNSSSIDPFDCDNSDYLVFENCYASDGKNGWFTFRTRPTTNIRLKRIYSGDMGDTGMILANRSHLVDDAFVCSSKVVNMDYYIVFYGGTNGGNCIVRNSQVFRFATDSHTNPHGITMKGDEYEDGFLIKYCLVENCTVDNCAEGVAFRHSTCTDNVARNITATQSGGSYGNLVTFRDDTNYNIIENSFADGVNRGVLFNMNIGEDTIGIAQAGGHHNKVINTVFSGCTDIIYNNSGIGGTILPSTYNEWLNCTFYNSTDFMHFSVVDLDSTNLVTNCIFDTVTTKGSQNLMTYDYNDFHNGFTATGTNTQTDDPQLDYSDLSLTSQTPSTVYQGGTDVGVYYDKDGRENITPFSLGAYYKNASDTYADYFINATNGSDSNDGSTEFLAFQTVSKVNSVVFSAGETIAFKKGETWNEELRLIVKYSGTVGVPITYTSYGSGEKPILNSNIEHSTTWTNISGNIWKETSLTYDPVRLLIDGVEKLGARSPDSNELYSELGTSIPDLVEWFWGFGNDSANHLYIYSATDPSSNTIIINNTSFQSALYMEEKDNITIDGLDLQGGSIACVRVTGGDNIIVKNCTIGKYGNSGFNIVAKDNAGTWNIPQDILVEDNNIDTFYNYDYSDTVQNTKNSESRAGADGIRVDGSQDGIFRNNIIKNYAHAGLAASLLNLDAVGVPTDNREVSGNVFYENYITCPDIAYGGKINIDGNTFSNEFYNNEIVDIPLGSQINGYSNHIHHNIFRDITNSPIKSTDSGSGIVLQGYDRASHDNIFEHNIFMNITGVGIWLSGNNETSDVTDHIFRNNIFYNCGTTNGNISIYTQTDYKTYSSDGNTFINNDIYSSLGSNTIEYYGVMMDVATFNTQTSHSHTINSNIDGDPLFVDDNSDWQLQDLSPCINVGVTGLATTDYYGNTIPYLATNTDIGINETDQ